MQSAAGAGQVILDNATGGTATALSGNGPSRSPPEPAGSSRRRATSRTRPTWAVPSSVTLTDAGPIGTSANPVQLGTTSLTTSTSAGNSSQFLQALTSNTVTAASLNAGSGTINLQTGSFKLGAANAISSTSAVSLANVAGTTLNLNNFNDTIASLVGGGTTGGNVTLGTATLTTGNSSSTNYGGVISGTGGLTTQGSADVHAFWYGHLYRRHYHQCRHLAGERVARFGECRVRCQWGNPGRQRHGGGVDHGFRRHLARSVFRIDRNGNLQHRRQTFNSGSAFDVDLNGTTAGSGYDQLDVTGNRRRRTPSPRSNLAVGPQLFRQHRNHLQYPRHQLGRHRNISWATTREPRLRPTARYSPSPTRAAPAIMWS